MLYVLVVVVQQACVCAPGGSEEQDPGEDRQAEGDSGIVEGDSSGIKEGQADTSSETGDRTLLSTLGQTRDVLIFSPDSDTGCNLKGGQSFSKWGPAGTRKTIKTGASVGQQVLDEQWNR